MSERAYTARELVGLPGMPAKSERSVYLFAERRGMVRLVGSRPARWLHHSLPAETRAALAAASTAEPPAPAVEAAAARGRAAARPRSPRDEQIADARLDILTAFDRWRRDCGSSVVMDDMRRFAAAYAAGEVAVEAVTRSMIASVGRTALDDWHRRRRAGGWSALLPRRGGHNACHGLIDADGALRDAIVAHILERPGHVNGRTIMRALRVSFDGARLPSYRTLQRWVSAWLAANPRLVSAVADPDRHRSRYLPAAGDAAAQVDHLNQLWELDSTPADVICTDGRHTIVGAIDVFSRRARVLVVPTSKAAAIAALLRRAILAWGVPETVRTDEGADYVSRHLKRALADLGIVHDVLPPFSPERKPFIERFFGTLARSLLQQLPGFAGHNVAEAQAIRSRKAFAARRGEGDAEAFKVALTAAELQSACDAWLEAVYEREPHRGLKGRSPFEAAAGQPCRRIDDERALDVLLAEPADGGGWRVVSKKGIHAEGTIFIAAELGALVGERVGVKLDPADAGGVYVFDQAGAFVCRAVAPEREGIDRQAVAAAMRQAAKAADAEARSYARKLKRQVKPEAAIEAILAAGRREAAQVVAFPAAHVAHDSPGLQAATLAVSAADAAPDDDASAQEREFMRRRQAALDAEAEARRRAEEQEEEALRALARTEIRKARAAGID